MALGGNPLRRAYSYGHRRQAMFLRFDGRN